MVLDPGTNDTTALLRQLTQSWARMLGPTQGLVGAGLGVTSGTGVGAFGKSDGLGFALPQVGQDFLGTLRQRMGGLQLEWRGGAPLGVESSPQLPIGRPLVFRVRQLDPKPVLQFVKDGEGFEPGKQTELPGETKPATGVSERPVTIVDVRTGARGKAILRTDRNLGAGSGLEPGPSVRLSLSGEALQRLDPQLFETLGEHPDHAVDVDRHELHQVRLEPAGSDRFHAMPVGAAPVVDHAEEARATHLEREAGLGRNRMRGMRRIDLDLSALGPVRLEFGQLGGRLKVRLGASRERTLSLLRSEGGRLREELQSLESLLALDVFRFDESSSARTRRTNGLDLML